MKICLTALVAIGAIVCAPASAQPLRVCQSPCGAQNSDQNIWVATCCQQKGATSDDAFNKCCASSCSTGSPCKWENLGSASASS
ncbi:PcF and SCR74-like cys-rich secreted peptide, putative [Phytophthora infestans T30-4]|uniref:PcF and SCR74-like cys-rich secreted peptide, putative n=1 Tax=Phytophthora infestans (strain T30-4) TaxID=403677 RepID=D0MRX4_PHYIT|nr:PcF and SCR74-like cys-rich secreted peptide, putative [Phytophthora infestans T30-4]EEY58243.1 PcF and SCR74-like cys-rich secreted peptide, putative [Phytophthora infestans T30-4]|eukprot:XP_002909429.1 PcF and SCR74-like cys-rich secreted peptide, putative [Phytophthora infestans T30-4]